MLNWLKYIRKSILIWLRISQFSKQFTYVVIFMYIKWPKDLDMLDHNNRIIDNTEYKWFRVGSFKMITLLSKTKKYKLLIREVSFMSVSLSERLYFVCRGLYTLIKNPVNASNLKNFWMIWAIRVFRHFIKNSFYYF